MSEQPIKKPWYYDALTIFGKLSGWILVPLIVGYTVGRWLDRIHDSAPKWFFVSVGISFVLSMIGMIYQTQIEYRKINTPKK